MPSQNDFKDRSAIAGLWSYNQFFTPWVKSNPKGTAAQFTAYMVGLAKQWAPALKQMGVQGVIGWDLSMQPGDAGWDYTGDLRITNPLFPASGIQQVMRVFSNAGMGVGCCVRHGILVQPQYMHGAYLRAAPTDYGDDVLAKLIAAQDLLGADAFKVAYVDSNILDTTRQALPVGPFTSIREARFPADYPNVKLRGQLRFPHASTLVAFEHTEPAPMQYLGNFAGYFTPDPNDPPPVRLAPGEFNAENTFFLIHPSDYAPWLETQFDAFVRSVAAGNVCIIRGMWPSDPYSDFIARVYKTAGA